MSDYIGLAPDEGRLSYDQRNTIIAQGGETTFNAVYTVGYLDVFLNGSKQIIGQEVIANNGTTFVFNTPLVLNDVVDYSYKTASTPYNYYTKPEIDDIVTNSDILKANINGSATEEFNIAKATSETKSIRADQSKLSALSVNCTQNAGALTFTLNPCVLDFRDSTITSGIINSRFVNNPITLTLPSGGTLGAVSTYKTRLVLIALDNAGVVELAILNISGGIDLSETSLISTTAISAASTANNIFYSTTQLINLPYKLVGIIDAINTTGVWGTPSLVQGSTGNPIISNSIGYGQKWQSVIGSRSSGVNYYNTTGKPIEVKVISTMNLSAAATYAFYVDGLLVDYKAVGQAGSGAGSRMTVGAIVNPGASYQYSGSGLEYWIELR